MNELRTNETKSIKELFEDLKEDNLMGKDVQPRLGSYEKLFWDEWAEQNANSASVFLLDSPHLAGPAVWHSN